MKRRAANITVDSVCICSKEKQSGNESNKKDDCQVNTYNESEINKSVDENATEQKKNTSEQKKNVSRQPEIRADDKVISSYPNNLPSPLKRMGEYSSSTFEHLATNNHGHTNSSGTETTSLPLIAEPSYTSKLLAVGGSQPSGCSRAHLENRTIHPPVIYSDQATSNIYRKGYGDHNILSY